MSCGGAAFPPHRSISGEPRNDLPKTKDHSMSSSSMCDIEVHLTKLG